MNQSILKIKHLLENVSAITKKHEEIAKITGQNFNVFNVLGLSINEVRTHSAFIAELLNPNGSHGQGNIFLKLFVKMLTENINGKDFAFDVDNDVRVETERYTGRINEEFTEGGYIDIIVENPKSTAIIIENKIYAEDQRNQLLRYYNYGKRNYNDYTLIYLTLYGNDASEYSAGDKKSGIDYHNLSYKTNITEWLELCKRESVNNPILRETIEQYIYLIKQLTSQAMSNIEKDEIIDLLKTNPELIDDVKKIASASEQLKNEIETDILQKLNETQSKKVESVRIINNWTISPKFIIDKDGFAVCSYVKDENNKVIHGDKTQKLKEWRVQLNDYFTKWGEPLC
ncbi:MAG: PD-(D/E)XK nuclease family protein [Chlorobi bacterium]|nr:PD-(D/E)XK nuclease family protein [Chlorobiota bacterium]